MEEDILEKLARSLKEDEKVQWEDLDDVLLELGISQGDHHTNILAVIYMVVKWYRAKGKTPPFYQDLRVKLKDRFKITGSGFIKTSSMEAWQLWKAEQKEIRKVLKLYKGRTKILQKEYQKKLKVQRKKEQAKRKRLREAKRNLQD